MEEIEEVKRISIKRCRELVDQDQQYSDEQLLRIRDSLYKLAEIVIAKIETSVLNFTKRFQTIDAKARIINN